MARLPRYPVYVPSKGRHHACQTAKFLLQDGCPFRLMVEAPEAKAYGDKFGHDRLLILPFKNQGLIVARNWIKDHSISEGHERHWQLDDNIRKIKRRWHGKRIPCSAGWALACVEDFVDRYTNIAIAGLNYEMFLPTGQKFPPFYRNCRVYSCSLASNAISHRWRLRYNDDTDICLQVLADGLCTVLVNAFMIQKITTMQVSGGNTDDLYRGDGRLRMARSLERIWPGVVETRRRFRRPQHVVRDAWRKFDNELQLKPGLDLSQLPEVDEQGLQLTQVKPVKSPTFQRFLARQGVSLPADGPEPEPSNSSSSAASPPCGSGPPGPSRRRAADSGDTPRRPRQTASGRNRKRKS